jgi:starch-binding outer membrane protein, SusD/RagB family
MLVNINKAKSTFIILSFLIVGVSCKKFVDVDAPLSKVDASVVYSNDASAIAVMTGLYNRMSSENNFATGQFSVSTLAAASADELKVNSTSIVTLSQAYSNSFTSQNAPFWTKIYNYIYTTNSVIEGVNASTTISDPVKEQLLGEAMFMRAFFHFYLVNLFGNVPIAVTTDYRINTTSSRDDKQMVYDQIISDLKAAQELLNKNFVGLDLKTTSTERVRPNKWAAMALLARVYLYVEDWANAESLATGVIGNTADFGLLKDLNAVFIKNSREAIWQLQPVINGYKGCPLFYSYYGTYLCQSI